MSSMNVTSGAPPPYGDTINRGFNPSMAIIIVVLISALFLVGFFSIYIRRCTQEDDGENRGNGQSRRNQQAVEFFNGRPGEGLEKAIVDLLPVVSYSVVKKLKEGQEDSVECAVCLERFEEEENVRLLPKCSHVFHSECIDVWFRAHSTCPLCRASLVPTFSEMRAGVPAVGDVSRRILEAQEEAFGSARQPPVPAAGDEQEEEDFPQAGSSRSDPGRNIGRGANDRNSARARLALFRNSDSFKQAARGVEVLERLAALSARYPASSFNPDYDKGPQRASSLNCVHFSLPRTASLTSASGRRDYYNSDIFPFGSQRFGVHTGAHSSSSLGRPGSVNRYELQKVGDLGNQNFVTEKLTEDVGSSSSAGSNVEQCIAIDLPLKEATQADSLMAQPSADDLHTRREDLTTTVPPVALRIPGPLGDKMMNDKTGAVGSWEQRISSLLLRRSASEGRTQVFNVQRPEGLVGVPANANVDDGTPSLADSSGNSSNPSFARRTMQWLAFGSTNQRNSSSARASTERRNELHRIVTQE